MILSIKLVSQLLLLGTAVGISSELVGIGGGFILVPALLFLLPEFGVASSDAMQCALATSLAVILLNSGLSAIRHWKLKNLDLNVIKFLILGMLVGGITGARITSILPEDYRKSAFGLIALTLSVHMFFSTDEKGSRAMPTPAILSILGIGIGTLASLAGISGGIIVVPFLNRHGLEIKKAIGSSSLCGSLTAAAGTIGFAWQRWNCYDDLPYAYNCGYIFLPALVLISFTSTLTAFFGARLTTKLPPMALKKISASFLVLVAISMLNH